MSFLLLVFLLDESHLELIEDILKKANFNNKDWDRLGRELGVNVELLKYIYSGNSLKLKECLRKWLTTADAATTRSYHLQIHDPPPTLDGLADVLDRISYNKAAEYIIKTCKLIIMFNDQCYYSRFQLS